MARPFRTQILLISFVVLVPLAGAIGWASRMTFREQVGQLEERVQILATAIAAYVDHAEAPAGQAPPELQRVLDAVRLPPGSLIEITDGTGGVVGRVGEGDAQSVVGRATSTRAPFHVQVSMPLAVAWARTTPIYLRNVIILGILTGVVLSICFMIALRFSRSLAHLERRAERVAQGDLGDLPPGSMPSREMEHLQDTFAAMVARLREARSNIAAQVEEERRMREEMQSLQRQVIRQERLAAIGALVSGVAHELNNPLQAIGGSAEILRRTPNLAPEIRADLDLIRKESVRASAIIRNLSRFGRQQVSRPVPVRLADVVASVIELRQRVFEQQNITLEKDERASSPVLAVFNELQQVVLNFVINAEQALAAPSAEQVLTAPPPPGAPAAPRRIGIRTLDVDDRIRLEVKDSGPGVPVEDEARLFQPFFTTKPVGEGTGLGLSVSYGIVQSYGGSIGYRRHPQGGAVFYFELPALTELGSRPPAL